MRPQLRKIKNDTPGETKLNKRILKHLPGNAIKLLQGIFNHTLSLGYFPSKFKTPIIKLIPEQNTDNSTNLTSRSHRQNIGQIYEQKTEGALTMITEHVGKILLTSFLSHQSMIGSTSSRSRGNSISD